MPRGKRVSPAERRNWLLLFEQGMPISKIATDSKRAVSAVRSHIEVARQEREQSDARGQLTRQAYEDHYRDLLGIAEQARSEAERWSSGSVSLPVDIRSRLLLQGLRQHAPNSALWAAWNGVVSRSLELLQVKSEFRDKLVQLSGELYPEINLDGVAASVTTRHGLSPELDRELDSWYRREQDGKGLTLSWGAHLIASSVTDESRIQEIQRWHTDLLDGQESVTKDLVARHRELISRGDTLARDLDEEVERLLLQRVLPGRCSICPDATPGRPTRARKTPSLSSTPKRQS